MREVNGRSPIFSKQNAPPLRLSVQTAGWLTVIWWRKLMGIKFDPADAR